MTDAVRLPRAQLLWPTVPGGHPDEAALDVLAEALGRLEKESRLYRRPLIYDAPAGQPASRRTIRPRALSGTFAVSITAQPTESLDDLVAKADAEIDRLQTEGPTEDEVRQGPEHGREAGLIIGLQSMRRKADFLNQNNVAIRRSLGLQGRGRDASSPSDADDVRRVARKYLTRTASGSTSRRGPRRPAPPRWRSRPQARRERRHGHAKVIEDDLRPLDPGAQDGPDPRRSRPRRSSAGRLSNGLEVLVAERHELPILTDEPRRQGRRDARAPTARRASGLDDRPAS